MEELATPPKDFGPRPELAWLPVKMLSVDPAYQRTLNSRAGRQAVFRIDCAAQPRTPHGRALT